MAEKQRCGFIPVFSVDLIMEMRQRLILGAV